MVKPPKNRAVERRIASLSQRISEIMSLRQLLSKDERDRDGDHPTQAIDSYANRISTSLVDALAAFSRALDQHGEERDRMVDKLKTAEDGRLNALRNSEIDRKQAAHLEKQLAQAKTALDSAVDREEKAIQKIEDLEKQLENALPKGRSFAAAACLFDDAKTPEQLFWDDLYTLFNHRIPEKCNEVVAVGVPFELWCQIKRAWEKFPGSLKTGHRPVGLRTPNDGKVYADAIPVDLDSAIGAGGTSSDPDKNGPKLVWFYPITR